MQLIAAAVVLTFSSVNLAYAGLIERLEDAREQGLLHGSVAVMDTDGFTHTSANGTSAHGTFHANTTDTTFRIASLTKLVTKLAVLKLVETGDLELDAPVSEYLPALRADWRKDVTVRHLLAMKSGLPRELFGSPERGVRFDDEGMLKNSWLAAYRRVELTFEPGTDQAYSNAGYWLLGAAIESVTKTPWIDACNALVCEPLGVDPVWVSTETLGDGTHAAGHTGHNGVAQRVDDFPIGHRYSSGSLSASAAQFASIAIGLFDNGFLSEDSRGLFFTNFGTEPRSDDHMIAGMLPGFMSVVIIDAQEERVLVTLNNIVTEDPNAFLKAIQQLAADH